MNILLGITGGIAAYKAPSIVSALVVNLGHNVTVCATKMALKFVTEMSLATMSNKPIITELEHEDNGEVVHIDAAQWCDRFVVVPCTANFIGKMATGIADDALSTIHLALPEDKVKIICPAMNTHMFRNPIVQKNIETLENLEYRILTPASGMLACGDKGIGKLPDIKTIIDFILEE